VAVTVRDLLEARARLADLAARIATTEVQLAETLERLANDGAEAQRRRRLVLAAEARDFADRERERAAKWGLQTD
jgi:hypothetical protein